MRDGFVDDPFLVVTAVMVGLLVLAVTGTGAVATLAELLNTWNYYFLMERFISTVTPIATVLLAVALLLGIAAVARA